MKKILFIAAIVSILNIQFSSLHAQGRFDASVFGGMNMCQIDGDGAGSYNHIGLHAGVGTSFTMGSDLGSPWRMVVEIAYTHKGSYIEASDRTLRANYIEIPIMLSFNAMDNRLRIAAGVAPGVLVGAKVTSPGDVIDQPSTDNFKSMDLLPLTFSARYRFGNHIGIEGRYQNSMLSITKENATGTYRIWRDNKGAFSRLLTIGLFYQF